APAIGSDFAVAGIEANNDMTREGAAGVAEKARILDGCGTDDDIRQAVVQIGFDGVQVADAAANLNGNFTVDGFDDGADGGFVFGLAGYGAVQVNQVQSASSLFQPLRGHGCRVFGEDGGVLEVAL